jgi:hypothetical protein
MLIIIILRSCLLGGHIQSGQFCGCNPYVGVSLYAGMMRAELAQQNMSSQATNT